MSKRRSNWSVVRLLFLDSKFVTQTVSVDQLSRLYYQRSVDCKFTRLKPHGCIVSGGNVGGYHKHRPKTIIELKETEHMILRTDLSVCKRSV